ncbi:MAG TPA: cysteine synthase family protein [Bacteroidales bacterium]|mgnify:FL=1|nr:cysteine synthase family protein [Bacteroidales bacterium]HOS58058.1 cysteine synthase family protein [Bacteroidales bacterium]
MKEKYINVLEQIGNTPLVKVNKLESGLCDLWLKLEYHNPGGSIKDRVALSMIEQAEKKGLLKPGDTIIEATAGNTGLGLALVAIFKGYKLVLVLPDRMSPDKIIHLKAMGVEVILTRSDVGKAHPDYYQNVARQIADNKTNYFHINQFANPDNPLAHETTTGPEIYEQTDGKVDAVVCGIGSSGTLTGLTNYFKKKKPTVELVVGDPLGSVYKEYVARGVVKQTGTWQIEGIGGDYIPPIANFDMVKKIYSITDEESFQALRNLLLKEGVFAGSSSGTILAAALRYCKEQTEPKTVVSIVCDSGNKYLNKVFNV